MNWIYIWLGVVVVSLIVEFVTLELVSIWISLGAFVGLILALFNVGYEIQLVAVIVISLLSILFLRKFAVKFLNKNKDKTNLDLAIGERVKLITKATSDQLGSTKYNGVVWSVKSQDGKVIEKGEYAEIVKIEGNKLIVKHIKNENKVDNLSENVDNKSKDETK